MKKGVLLILGWMILRWMCACEGTLVTPLDVDYSDHQPRGVIFSFLSNSDDRDTAFRRSVIHSSVDMTGYPNRIFVIQSTPPGGFSRSIPALVHLESDGREIPLEYIKPDIPSSMNREFYSVGEDMIPGKGYRVTAAQDPDDPFADFHQWSVVTATDTMPAVIPFEVEDAGLRFHENMPGRSPEGGYIDIKIEGEPDRENLYKIEVVGIAQFNYSPQMYGRVIPTSIERPDKNIDLEIFGTSQNEYFYEGDFSKEGRRRVQFRFNQSHSNYNRDRPMKILIRVSNLSDHYRKFKESSDDYEMNEENPFAEPAEIYTNVENGHGIFALAGRSYAELELK